MNHRGAEFNFGTLQAEAPALANRIPAGPNSETLAVAPPVRCPGDPAVATVHRAVRLPEALLANRLRQASQSVSNRLSSIGGKTFAKEPTC